MERHGKCYLNQVINVNITKAEKNNITYILIWYTEKQQHFINGMYPCQKENIAWI